MTDKPLTPSPCHPLTLSRPSILRSALLAVTLAALTLDSGCKARKDYPEPNLGSHSPSYNVVFGRLVRVPGRDPDAPPTWLIRFGFPHDAYQGELALTSPSPNFILGYTGGEPVELHGHVLPQTTTDAYNGRWYQVDSIQLWSGYKQ